MRAKLVHRRLQLLDQPIGLRDRRRRHALPHAGLLALDRRELR